MLNLKSATWLIIKSKAGDLVKHRPSCGAWIVILNVIFCSQPIAIANSYPTSPNPNPITDKKLPEIVAKEYALRVEKRSRSNRVYILEETSDSGLPVEGETLLLKEGSESVMGFRVLKVEAENKQIAVKRLKRYLKHVPLKVGEVFTAVEKIRDIIPVSLSDEDTRDLIELQKSKSPPPEVDDDSDKKPVPRTDGDLDASEITDSPDEEEEHNSVTVEEGVVFDSNRHWVSVGFGYVRNSSTPGTGDSTYYSNGNIHYGYTLTKYLWFKRPTIQDSLTLEGGMFLYKNLNYVVANDTYTVMALAGSLRYNLLFSESFGMFFYAGIMRSQVTASAQSQADGIAALTNTVPIFGGGLFFQMGPSWYIRTDLGIDVIGLGLTLKF